MYTDVLRHLGDGDAAEEDSGGVGSVSQGQDFREGFVYKPFISALQQELRAPANTGDLGGAHTDTSLLC